MPFIKISLIGWIALTANAWANGTSVSNSEYGKKTTELRNLEAKIKDAETQISNLIAAKNKTEDLQQKHLAMDEMVKTHSDLVSWISKYNKLRLELKYNFPNRGEEIDTRYKSRDPKSLNDMERGDSLTNELLATKQAVDKKYAPLVRQPADLAPRPSSQPQTPILRLEQ